MRDMKVVRHHEGKRFSHNTLHVETDLGIVNIHVGLHDAKGRKVTTIEVIPDKYAGSLKVAVRGSQVVRLVQAKKARW